MNTGGGTLVFSGSVTSGTGEMVLHAANGNITLGGLVNSGNLVTVTGSGTVKFNTGTYSGSGGLTMNGSGLLDLQASTNNFTGTVTANSGTLQIFNSVPSGNITLNGGSLKLYFGADMNRNLGSIAGRIQIIGGDSGFDGNNGDCIVNFGGAGAEVQWGSTFFNPTSLRFQDTAGGSGTSDRINFANALDLNGVTRTIAVNGSTGGGAATMSGVIRNSLSGSTTAGLIKTGVGTLALSVANTYNGGTTVSAGTLNASTAAARLGSDTVGNNIAVSPGARLLLTNAANAGANQVISLTSTAGSLPVLGLGFNGIPNAALAFGSTGVLAINTTGYNTDLTGILSGNSIFLGSTSTGTFIGGASTIAAGAGSLYRLGGGGGQITFSTADTITGANDVQIGSTATNGTGTVVFSASQNFSGSTGITVINGSTLSLTASQAFTSPTTVNSGGTLTTSNTISIASSGVTNAGTATLGGTINWSGGFANTGTLTLSGTNTFGGLVTTSTGMTLATGGVTQTFNGGLTLNGGTVSVTSAGSANIAGSGLLTISTATFSTNGTVNIANDIKFNAGGTLTLTRPAGSTPIFNLSGDVELAGAATLTMGVSTTAGDLTFSGDISDPLGDFSLTVGGTGQAANKLTLSGDNSNWSGGLTTNLGSGPSLNINSATALGTGKFTIGGTTLIDNTSLGGAITLSTNNAQDWNSNFTFTGTNDLNMGTGAVTMNNNRTVTVTAGTFTVGGAIGQSGGTRTLTKDGAGTLVLGGASTYGGVTTVSRGNLVAAANAPSGSAGAFGNASSEIVFGTAGSNNAAGILISGGNYTVGRAIRLATSNDTDAGTRVLTIGGNSAHNTVFSGNIFLGTSAQTSKGIRVTAASNGKVTFSGVIQETGGTRTGAETTAATALDAVTKVGAGTVEFTNANTYLGKTVVNAGTLLVNNTTSSGTGSNTVTVNAGTLGGTGSISGAVTIGDGTGSADAVLAPGMSIESLATGNLSFASDGSYAVEVDGSSATSDQTIVTGSVSIHAATTLVPNVTGTLVDGQKYFIVVNDDVGADAIGGSFASLPQGALVGTYGSIDLRISYTGDSTGGTTTGGNDIVLYAETSVGGAPEIAIDQGGDIANGGSKGFGTVTLGSNTSLVFTIANTGTADLDLEGFPNLVAVGGANASDFTVTAQPATDPVPAGDSTTFTVQFAPTAAGVRNATLTIDNNDTTDSEDPFIINISGTGQTQYDAWSGGAGFNADANGDGVDNGLAFLLGAADPNANALGLLPNVTEDNGKLVMTFSMRNASARGAATLNVEHSNDVGIGDTWSSILVPETTPGVQASDVHFTISPGSPLNGVTATIQASEAGGSGKLFGRLKGVKP